MESTSFIKEEEMENDQIDDILKKEEDIYPKIEYNESNDMSYANMNPYLSTLPAPWLNYQIIFPYQTANLTIAPIYNFYPNTSQRKKPFLIIKDRMNMQNSISNHEESISDDTREATIEVKPNHIKQKNKVIRVSACKNYIGLVCARFSRIVLTAEANSQILDHIKELLTQKKGKFETLRDQPVDELFDSLKKYIRKAICGKKVKRSHRERDFKIRNARELDNLLTIKEADDEFTCLRKEVLKEGMSYFITSDYYYQWLTKGLINEANRCFFLKNRKEVQKKFLNPGFYKPRFNFISDEQEEL